MNLRFYLFNNKLKSGSSEWIVEKSKGSVLITGGAKRIGREICLYLAQNKYEMIIHTNHSIDEANELMAQIAANGGNAKIIQGDLDDDDFTNGLIEKASKIAQTNLIGLINNASVFENDDALYFTQSDWQKHFKINAMVPCLLAQNFAKIKANQNQGVVINILDQRIFRPNPLFFTYTLSKNTLATATKTMAQAYAPNIRVNAIAPGPSLQNSRQKDSDFQAQIAASILKTGSPPQAIAQTVHFLLEAQHITGQIIAVDGGQSLIWSAPDIEGINE